MSVSIQQVQLGQRFSFEVYPSAKLGTFNDVTLLSVLSPSDAMAMGYDIAALHANVYRTLPPTTPNDPMAYNYIRVRHDNGRAAIVGIPYIREDSIVLITQGVLTLRFDGVDQAGKDLILEALSANGKMPSTVTFTQN